MCANKKKSLGAKSELNGGSTFWSVTKSLIWADVREFALPLWTMNRFSNWCCIAIQISSSIHSCRDNPRQKLWKIIARKCLRLKIANFPMQLSDWLWQHQKYARPETYLATLVLLHACEIWKVTDNISNKLQVFVNIWLRTINRIFSPKTVTNQELLNTS